ncbi:hypothetical protein ACIRU2_27275 [Streptomyces sp. NPDC101169]|uniref:hypothetical protein n=1 Tax=Streptomyces sp. NPDC101169 TaxID=3366121 RepID=UPI0037F28FD9
MCAHGSLNCWLRDTLLCPTRYWALFKLRDNAWQSRGLTAKTALPTAGRRTSEKELVKA